MMKKTHSLLGVNLLLLIVLLFKVANYALLWMLSSNGGMKPCAARD